MDDLRLDRRQVCLSDEGRAALLDALRKHFPKYPKGVYPDRWDALTHVDQRTVAKMLEPNQRVRQASIDTAFKDLGAVFNEDAHLGRPVAVESESSVDKKESPGLGEEEPADENRPSPGDVGVVQDSLEARSSVRDKRWIGFAAAAALVAVCIGVARLVFTAGHSKPPGISAAGGATGATTETTAPSAAGGSTGPASDTEQSASGRVLLYDHFTVDSALDPDLWSINAPTTRTLLAKFESPTSTIVAPKITFDAQNGLGIGGINGGGQLGGIQSAESFVPPFTVTALCNATSIRGGALRLAIARADGGAGISLGFVNESYTDESAASFVCTAPAKPGVQWQPVGQPLSPLPPAPDIWYVLAIAVDGSGKATVAVSSGDFPIGKATGYVGVQPFYVVMAQEGWASDEPGSNQAYCGVIQVISKAEE